MFKHMKQFIRENYIRTVLGLAILIAIDALQLVTPRLLGALADDLTAGSLTMSGIYWYIGIIFGVAALIAVGRYYWRILINGTARKAEYWLRNKLFTHLETLSWEYMSKHKVGDLMALATNDVTSVGQAGGMGLVMLIDAVFMTFMTIGLMMTTIDPLLTLMAVLPLPIIAVIVGFGGRLVRTRFKRVQEAFSHMTDMVQEAFSGIRIIKTYTREAYHLKQFDAVNDENYRENMSLIKMWGIVFPMVKTISAVSLIITLAIGGNMVIDGSLSVGKFVAFVSYIGMLTWPMMAIGWVVNVMERGYASLSRINEFLDIEPDIRFGNEAINPSDTVALKVENLCFHYPGTDTPVLKNISFEIKKGEKVGLIGRTGSGKTTLTHLLMKNWTPTSGRVYIENSPLEDLSKAAIKAYFAVVPQDNFLFSRNIEENIRFFEEDVPTEMVVRAAQTANVHEEILSFASGYDTLLGERGVNLSGGQKQRISIARALCKNASFIVLDDALSAVDTKTEEAILRHLKEALSDQTALIIAHRISAIKDCDHILVLEDGEITAMGKHEVLIGREGLYKQLYEKQQLEDKLMEV